MSSVFKHSKGQKSRFSAGAGGSYNIWIGEPFPVLYVVLRACHWSLVSGRRYRVRSYQKPVTSDRQPAAKRLPESPKLAPHVVLNHSIRDSRLSAFRICPSVIEYRESSIEYQLQTATANKNWINCDTHGMDVPTKLEGANAWNPS